MFEKEPYSKQAYECAEADLYHNLSISISDADERVQRILATGREEAPELNAKYYELKQRAIHAATELLEFEHARLGMHQKDPGPKSD